VHAARRRELAVAIRRDVPDRPGVYLFRDERGETLYIGKSVTLRRRMLSYFRPSEVGPGSRMRHMSFAIDGFEFRETGSELLALLLEDTLIKRERPPHNKRQREHEEHRYLVLTDDRYPTCRIVAHPGEATGTAFGPFGDRRVATTALDVIHRHFQLRSCVDREPFRESANFELGFCAGPCRDLISVAGYAEVAGRVADFLGGDDGWITEKLEREMEACAAALDYEQAAVRRKQLEAAAGFCRRQRFIRDFRTRDLVVGDAAAGLQYHFARGNLVEVLDGDNEQRTLDVAPELLDPLTEIEPLIDRANLVDSWLAAGSSQAKTGRISAWTRS
jgi:excinuclease ABC subunit C